MAEETYEYHVLEEDLVPIKRASFSTLEDAEDFVALFGLDFAGKLYIVQRPARFSYR